MPTIFRFAIQTMNQRFSEIWSFYCNDARSDIYATRTSMKNWLKISFHGSQKCHIKTYDPSTLPFGRKDHEWKFTTPTNEDPVHLMRIIYDVNKQRANFPFEKRVQFAFEEWSGLGSIYVDTFIIHTDTLLQVDTDNNVVAVHHLGDNKWVYFKVTVAPPTDALPEPISGMSVHLGEKDHGGVELRNSTAVWYSVPQETGTLVITEGSWDNLNLNAPS